MPDDVHLLVSIPPKLSVSSFKGYLKGKSSLMLFEKHVNLRYKHGNRKFWAEGYYVSTVGLNESTIAKYIREQENADLAQDKLSAKEYEDPLAMGDFGVKSKPVWTGSQNVKSNEPERFFVQVSVLRRRWAITGYTRRANHLFSRVVMIGKQ